MALGWFLHIQADEGSPARVLELPGDSVRIGSGARCELCLPDAGLAEVQCILRRRGATWHLLPVGQGGRVVLDGRPVEGSRPLGPGSSFRVGEHLLVLRTSDESASPLGSFERPIVVDPLPPGGPPPSPPPSATVRVEARSPAEVVEAERQRLLDWQSRMADHGRRLRDRERERRSEARRRVDWRGFREPGAPPTPSAGAPLRPTPRVRIAPDEPVAERAPSPPPVPPPEVKGPSPVRIAPDEEPPTAPSQPAAASQPAEVPPPAAAPRVKFLLGEAARRARRSRGGGPHERGPAAPGAGFRGGGGAGEPRTAAEGAQGGCFDRAPSPQPSPTRAEGERPAGSGVDRVAPAFDLLTPPDDRGGAGGGIAEAAEERSVRTGSVSGEDGRLPSIEALGSGAQPVPGSTGQDRAAFEHAGPFVAHTAQEVGWTWEEGSRAVRGAWKPGDVAEPEWPSARDLIESHRSLPPVGEGAASRPEPARRVNRPQPTVAAAPASWSVPAWAAVGPVAAGWLAFWGIGLFLAWTWGRDDRAAGVLADRLADPKAAPAGLGELPEGPGAAWWASTSGHLYLRAMAAAHDETDPDRADTTRFYLEAARSAGPLDRAARLASAGDDASALGLSRDVIALRRTGRALLKAGKVEQAMPAFRRALEMAARTDLERAPTPSFLDDAQIHRFALPFQDELAAIVNEAIGPATGAEIAARLGALLPESPLAWLAAYRVLSDRGEAGAEAFLDRILAEQTTGDARGLAARAEAEAYRGRWDAAAADYRAALELVPSGEIRRSWALNLAEIESRLGHDEAMRDAWDAARGPVPDDPVNARLTEARRRHGSAVLPPGALALPGSPRRDPMVAPAEYRPAP